MSRVVPLGLIAVVTACPTVKIGSNDKPGFKAWNDDPEAADGVICTPVGMKVPFLRSSSSALAEITAPILITLKIASARDRKSTRLNSSHLGISYAVFCLKKKKKKKKKII